MKFNFGFQNLLFGEFQDTNWNNLRVYSELPEGKCCFWCFMLGKAEWQTLGMLGAGFCAWKRCPSPDGQFLVLLVTSWHMSERPSHCAEIQESGWIYKKSKGSSHLCYRHCWFTICLKRIPTNGMVEITNFQELVTVRKNTYVWVYSCYIFVYVLYIKC